MFTEYLYNFFKDQKYPFRSKATLNNIVGEVFFFFSGKFLIDNTHRTGQKPQVFSVMSFVLSVIFFSKTNQNSQSGKPRAKRRIIRARRR